MRIFAIILFLCMSFQGIACTCSTPEELKVAQKNEFESSNLIMIGNVIEISTDQRLLTVIIREIFKGNLNINDTIVFENNYYCEPFVNVSGDWLFYGNLIDGEFNFNECGLSRSLNFPEKNLYFSFCPAPPARDEVKDEITFETEIKIGEQKARKFAKDVLEKEIVNLRNLKNKMSLKTKYENKN